MTDIENNLLSSLEEFSISLPNDFEPNAEELESFYESLDNGIIPELQWKCPERRPPTPTITETKSEEIVPEETPLKNDFDYDDIDNDFDAVPTMRVRQQKGNVKKKQANFAGVMDALKKQMLNKDDT